MPKISSHLSALTDVVRRQARSRIKVAALGGEQDMPFEQAFSNLAHAYLKDKAPSLLNYEVGFQLVDRNQENTKAIGVFGFKIGSQWIYAPVFFLNGDLKGHELLYIKNQDMFVPLKENWLNYLLNRKPNLLGSEVGRNLQQVGVMPPHLYQLSRSPAKYASFQNMSPWAQEAMPTVAHWIVTNPTKDAKYKDISDLPTFLKKEGKAVVKSLVLGFQSMPKLAQAFDQFHGLNVIDEILLDIQTEKTAASSNSVMKEAKCVNTPAGPRCFKPGKSKSVMTPAAQPPSSTPTEVNTEPGDTIKGAELGDPLDSAVTYSQQKKLKIVVYDEVLQHGTGMENLTDKEREKLLSDKVLIKDERPDATKAYEVTSPVRIQNPMETGLYEVLTKENKFEKCLIIFGPYSQRLRADFVTIVRIDGSDDKGRAWMNTHPSQIWVGHQYSNEEYQKWWNELTEVKDLPSSGSGLYIIIGNTGEGSLPFEVEKEVSTGERKIYDVYFKRHAEKERAGNLPPISTRLMHYRGDYGEDNGCRIQLTGKRGARLRSTGGDLYVPADYKKLTLRPTKEEDGEFGICGCDAHSDPTPIQPGNQLDIDFLLGTKTASVKMFTSGNEFVINGNRMQKLAALIHLVRDWGFREKIARQLIKKAETDKVYRFRVKKSVQEWEMQKGGPSAPAPPETPTGFDPMTGGQYPTQNMGEWNMKIPELSAANTDRMIYHPMGPDPQYQQGPDRAAQQSVMQAAQSGQKEIFDTAMIGSLLKAVRDDSMVDRYMGDLMKGLDRLGRILFLFYWHGEKFQERYGKGDMVELEDGIRNAFEYLGDLVLFLKQRSVDPDSQMGGDLSEISGD